MDNMTMKEFIQFTEKAGFYILEHDFSCSIPKKKEKRINRSILHLRGRYFKFVYIHLRQFQFRDAKINNYGKAYRYLLDSLAQEVIEA